MIFHKCVFVIYNVTPTPPTTTYRTTLTDNYCLYLYMEKLNVFEQNDICYVKNIIFPYILKTDM